jgi:hypothetical protein
VRLWLNIQQRSNDDTVVVLDMVVADQDQAADGVAVAVVAGAVAMVEAAELVSWGGQVSALGAPCPASAPAQERAMSRRTEQAGW